MKLKNILRGLVDRIEGCDMNLRYRKTVSALRHVLFPSNSYACRIMRIIMTNSAPSASHPQTISGHPKHWICQGLMHCKPPRCTHSCGVWDPIWKKGVPLLFMDTQNNTFLMILCTLLEAGEIFRPTLNNSAFVPFFHCLPIPYFPTRNCFLRIVGVFSFCSRRHGWQCTFSN